MKLKFSFASVLVLLGLPFSAHAILQDVIQVPKNVFIPHGFDNNDQAEIVLHGFFPNTCYHAGPATATRSGDKITIKNLAFYETDVPCMKMIVPWTTTVNVGVLQAGNYEVLVQKSESAKEKFGTLPVASSLRDSVDDYLYAYVNNVLVELDASRVPTVTVRGTFSLSCMYLKEVSIVQKSDDVIDVLPIVAIDQTKPCENLFVPVPYKETAKLKQALPADATLFYIRSMNGQSLSFVQD